jgi:hypothetical protein
VKQNEPSTAVFTSTLGVIKKEIETGKAKEVEERER